MTKLAARKKINFSKSVETCNMILDATENVIEEVGINDFFIQDVAKKSGYGVGTVYLYFNNKASLLEGLLRREVLNITHKFHDQILPKLPMKPEDFLFDCFLLLLKSKKFHIYNQLFGITSVLESKTAGIDIFTLLLENIEKEIGESLKITMDSESLSKKSVTLIHCLKGLLSVDLEKIKSTDGERVFIECEDYAKWLSTFTLNFLKDKAY